MVQITRNIVPGNNTQVRNGRKTRARLLASAAAAAVLLAGSGTVRAANDTWSATAAGTAYLWNDVTNWASTTQFPNAIDDVANLNNDIAGAQTISLGQAITVGTLNLGDSDGGNVFFGFTVQNGTGGSLTFSASSGTAAINKLGTGTTADDTVSATVTLNSNLVVQNTSASNLILSGTIGQSGGSFGLTKTGSGTVRISGVNT
ncbi:MAG: hypothetical protein ABSH20_06455, partial [Tepidisphaeraceae bacterium]